MRIAEWGATVAGFGLIVLAGHDVFHTLLHPSGKGTLSNRVFRAVWWVGHRLGGRGLALAGPAGFVAMIGLWAGLLSVGWALVYLPHLPDDFQYGSGVAAQTGPVEALYVSLVAMTTVGFGDIVAEVPTLRLALVLEALMGFALLTAAISWILSVYPALGRRRALANRIAILLGDEPDDRVSRRDQPEILALVLEDLVKDLAMIRVDLIQYPATYFFTSPDRDFALPYQLPRLRTAVMGPDLPAEARQSAESLRSAIDGYVLQLAGGPHPVTGGSPEEALRSYANDQSAG